CHLLTFQYLSRPYQNPGQIHADAFPLIQVTFQIISGFLTLVSQFKQLVVTKPKWPSDQHGREDLTAGIVFRSCPVVDTTRSLEPLFYLIDRPLHDFHIVVAPHRRVILTRNQSTRASRRNLRQNLLFSIPIALFNSVFSCMLSCSIVRPFRKAVAPRMTSTSFF